MNNSYSSQSDQKQYSGLSLKKTAITLGVLVFTCIVIITLLKVFKPEAKKKPKQPNVVTVQTTKATIGSYPIILSSNGSVQAKTSSRLVAQISGEITNISDIFTDGGEFKKGDTLLTVDQRNYLAAVSSASANLSQAQANYQSESARAAQATKDWQRLGYTGEPNDQVLRKPQLSAAKAQLASAKASLASARLNLSKTKVKAPYDGNVLQRNVGLGQFVNTGTVLGNVFSTEGIEVTLPLNQEQYAQLDFSAPIPVTLSAELAGINHNWPATLTRTAQAFDTATRQINAIASVEKTMSNHGLELKIGQYVNAKIIARTIQKATTIPNSAIREGSYIYLFEEGVLTRKNVDLIWQDDTSAVIPAIPDSSNVVTTSLSGVVSGTKAKLFSGNKGKGVGKGKPKANENVKEVEEGNKETQGKKQTAMKADK